VQLSEAGFSPEALARPRRLPPASDFRSLRETSISYKGTLALCIAILIAISGFLVGATYAFAKSAEKVLYAFTGGTDGGNPQAGLIVDEAGNLYGTTASGGANNVGTVFRTDGGPERNVRGIRSA
jgi:uncharacterized repeat protein (TIGR03803 family)